MSAAITQAAIRALRMTPEELEEKLALCSNELRTTLVAEMGAIQWMTGMWMIWNEQGVHNEVLTYAQDRADEPAEVPTGV